MIGIDLGIGAKPKYLSISILMIHLILRKETTFKDLDKKKAI